MNTDAFTWDAVTQTFTIETSDYDQYDYWDTLHQLQLIAHYESFPADSGDVLLFSADLIVDCNRVPYVIPTFDNYEYIIDISDPTLSIYVEPTHCGPWLYDPEDASYKKNFPWCAWCAYSNFGLFNYDLTLYTLTIEDAAGFDVGVYSISIPIRIPNSDVLEYIEFVITISYCQVH